MIEVLTHTDGGQDAVTVAREIARFLDEARHSLELAHYDLHLGPETAAVVREAIVGASERGVAVRVIFNVDHRNPIPVPPPPEPDAQLIASFGVPSKAIAGVPDLMHHKYVVRDGEAVWTGSMNWTDDSFTRQENVIAVVRSQEVAAGFARNFTELWDTGAVELSGFIEPVTREVGKTPMRTWFTPGYGEALSYRIAKYIGRARRRVRVCSPVITAAPVLATLAQLLSEGRIDVAGCVDLPQIRGVVGQWRENGNAAWKLPLLERTMAGDFTGKRSTPWRPEGSVHDFMHAKVTVADGVVFLGSFNLSRSGERNAENVLEIHDGRLADRLAAYIDDVRARYPRVALAEIE